MACLFLLQNLTAPYSCPTSHISTRTYLGSVDLYYCCCCSNSAPFIIAAVALQSRFVDIPVYFWAVCRQNGTAVLKGLQYLQSATDRTAVVWHAHLLSGNVRNRWMYHKTPKRSLNSRAEFVVASLAVAAHPSSPISRSIHQSISRSINQSINQSINNSPMLDASRRCFCYLVPGTWFVISGK